ncbi:MAG: hypothetical protein IJY61_00545 [Candidatus Gastranaerophilales bacterium]|nr:hypothetical protein [Candidatus Gastranaerophilales bacterium]
MNKRKAQNILTSTTSIILIFINFVNFRIKVFKFNADIQYSFIKRKGSIMTNINGVPPYNSNQENIKTNYEQNDIQLENISILYTTEAQEEDRTTFEDTFDKVFASEVEQGQEFLNGLIDNKDSLMKDLGLTDSQYDSLACTALALASQETGMGEEKGYNEENKGIGKLFRGIMKQIDVLRGGASASSGLTQMKIYDFLNDSSKLSEEQRNILKDYGITADGIAENNLYENPDKAAIATMVVLKSLTEKYDDYKKVLSTENKNLEDKLGITSEAEKAEVKAAGDDILAKISEAYENNGNDEKKSEIRTAFKEWLLAKNDTKKSDKVDKEYNEEIQLEELNELLGGNPKLDASDLDIIRYSLTTSGSEMNMTEYCAYAWNKGTGTTGMQLDRLLADKIGTILKSPEDFDYDQFTVNVATLAEKYASQSL